MKSSITFYPFPIIYKSGKQYPSSLKISTDKNKSKKTDKKIFLLFLFVDILFHHGPMKATIRKTLSEALKSFGQVFYRQKVRALSESPKKAGNRIVSAIMWDAVGKMWLTSKKRTE